MMYRSLILLTVAILFLVGCGHTNKLAENDLRAKVIYFDNKIASGAKEVRIDFSKSVESQDETDAILDAVADAGSSVISTEVKSRFENAIDDDKLIDNLVKEIDNTISKLYNIKIVDTPSKETEFFVETTLNKCQLSSSELGVNLMVDATTKIYNRVSLELIWEYSASNIVQINHTKPSVDSSVNTGLSVINAAQLSILTDEQLRNNAYTAASGVGEIIAESLKDDIEKNRKSN